VWSAGFAIQDDVRGFYPYSRRAHLASSEEKNQQVYFSVYFLHSIHTQSHFFADKLKIFVHFNDSIRGDW